MNPTGYLRILPVVLFASLLFACQPNEQTTQNPETAEVPVEAVVDTNEFEYGAPTITALPIDDFTNKGLDYLAEAQHPNGGWGGGSHSAQSVRDPHAVATDPATTAFVAMAMLRTGSTIHSGQYKDHLRKATGYLLKVIEESPESGPQITTQRGTQPQSKLGANIDPMFAAQFLSRIAEDGGSDGEFGSRIRPAIAKCIEKIQGSQATDGSWGREGWAPVLQSTMANSALEMADIAGVEVDSMVLEKSRDYQKSNFDEDGNVNAADGAGIELYSITGNVRANAKEYKEAEYYLDKAKAEGKVSDTATVTEESLIKSGVPSAKAGKMTRAYSQVQTAKSKLTDETVLSGFGNNGGEEFLSYMMTSESMVVSGEEEWQEWHGKMSDRFKKIQNQDGSWSGHHCITSPVFCTAAVVMAVTADRDNFVLELSKGTVGSKNKVSQ